MAKREYLKDEELEYIKANLMIKTTKEIAEDLGRNYYTVYRVSRQLGIKKSKTFTPQEDAYIMKNYKKDGAKKIAAKMGVTVHMVYNRVRTLRK